MQRVISLLGSTGSIGTQTLKVAKRFGYKVEALAANSNIDLIEKYNLEIESYSYDSTQDNKKKCERLYR